MTTIGNDYSKQYTTIADSSSAQGGVETQTEQKEEASLFEKMDNWTNAHANNMKEATENIQECSQNLEQAQALLDSIKDEDKRAEFEKKINELLAAQDECMASIEEQYEQNAEEIGKSFDFMEGTEDYDGQTAKLAQGAIDKKDVNGDGRISLQEFVFDEVGETDQYESDELLQDAVTNAILTFKLMDEGMGNSDKSGDLTAAEFQSLYKNLDGFVGVDNIKTEEDGSQYITGEFDGKFDIENSADFLSYAIGNIFSEETYASVKEHSLEMLKAN